jgi:hypothetical protein
LDANAAPNHSLEGKWYLIGFALDPSDGMKMFAYEKGVRRSAPMMQNMQDWPKGTLMRMPTVRMFETIGMQYDDARLFTGKLSQGTIESMHTCGRPTFCSERARARRLRPEESSARLPISNPT